MQLVEIPPIPLGVSDLYDAFDKVFREETLRAVHGTHLVSVSPWVPRGSSSVGEKRKVVAHMPVPDDGLEGLEEIIDVMGFPKTIKITTKQTVNRSNSRASSWEIQNRVSLASAVGSLLGIHVAPTFYLERQDGQVYFSGRVEHKVLLIPPPFNTFKRTIEEAMAKETKIHIDKYAAFLTNNWQYEQHHDTYMHGII